MYSTDFKIEKQEEKTYLYYKNNLGIKNIQKFKHYSGIDLYYISENSKNIIITMIECKEYTNKIYQGKLKDNFFLPQYKIDSIYKTFQKEKENFIKQFSDSKKKLVFRLCLGNTIKDITSNKPLYTIKYELPQNKDNFISALNGERGINFQKKTEFDDNSKRQEIQGVYFPRKLDNIIYPKFI